MSWLKTIWTEFVGLFIDDVSFAIAIVIWLIAAYGLFHMNLVPAFWRGPLLFAGLAVIFVENTLRRSRK
jgi:uncharacterized membrane protein